MSHIETKSNTVEELLQLVSFQLGDAVFGVEIYNVQEINKMLDLTKVPNAATYIKGVVNLRGRIIPVLCLREKIGLKPTNYNSETRIIVVELDDKTVGFIVDEVKEVLRIPKNTLEIPPKMVLGVNSEYLSAIAKLENRLLILLDLTKILSDTEMINPN